MGGMDVCVKLVLDARKATLNNAKWARTIPCPWELNVNSRYEVKISAEFLLIGACNGCSLRPGSGIFNYKHRIWFNSSGNIGQPRSHGVGLCGSLRPLTASHDLHTSPPLVHYTNSPDIICPHYTFIEYALSALHILPFNFSQLPTNIHEYEIKIHTLSFVCDLVIINNILPFAMYSLWKFPFASCSFPKCRRPSNAAADEQHCAEVEFARIFRSLDKNFAK